jgi:hypothetical protein
MGRPRKNPITANVQVLTHIEDTKQMEIKETNVAILENPPLKIETFQDEKSGFNIGVKITGIRNSDNTNIAPKTKNEALAISNVKSTSDSVVPDAKISVESLEIKEIGNDNEQKVFTLDISNNININKNNIPPVVRKRNEYGFLENVDYVFKEDGKVDWRKMIKPEFLVFNREKTAEIEKKYGKKLDDLSVTEVDDKYLLILLFGIRNLATIRGFYSVSSKVAYCSDFKATVTTHIDWIPNNDTEMREEMYSDTASASVENTNGFGKMFLETIATNRAFVRAVRNYLEINIVGFDEIKNDKSEPTQTETSPISAHSMLEKAAKESNLTFEQFKEGVKLKYSDIIESDYSKWSRFTDLSPNDAYKMLNILKKAQQAKK